MNQDEVINDAFDTELTRLFAEKNEVLSSDQFMQRMLSRLEHEHRRRSLRRGLVIGLIMLLAAVAAPWVMQWTMDIFSHVGQIKQIPDVAMSVGMLLIAGGLFFRARRWL